jgi:Subtilase family
LADLKHLGIDAFRDTDRFRARQSPRELPRIKQRQRKRHGDAILAQLQRLSPVAAQLVEERREFAEGLPDGMYLVIESEPDFDLKAESLDRASDGIELLSLHREGKRTLATVFVPDGALAKLERLVQDYLSKDNINKRTNKHTPRNNELIANIRSIRRAALRSLWTDDPLLLPTSDDEVIWWEVWLRAGDDRESLRTQFRGHAEALGLVLSRTEERFPDRTVLAVRGNREQLTRSITLLNCIAELRRLRETADLVVGLPAPAQWTLTNELLRRVKPPVRGAPVVCVLDTGISAHPLLSPALDATDCHTVNPAWRPDDTFGHGTQMAGLALYGDLCEVFASAGRIALTHRLESVKVLRQNGDNAGELLGALTREAMARPAVAKPRADRLFCLAVGSKSDRLRGRPSAWSAAIDRLASGAEDAERRLVVLAAGNVEESDQADYPAVNAVDNIHDPAQSWNAVTVGAVTFKCEIDQREYKGFIPLAPIGGLSPYSCSSVGWERAWPIKPEVVFEGGNRALGPDGTTDSLRSLDLLTVDHRPATRPFDSMWGTSAAAALGSRMAAAIKVNYPDYWPETVRGLLVHSARWTESMMRQFAPRPSRKRDIENLLRHCGYGLPSEQRALWSASNALTLISQQEIQPFEGVLARGGTGRVERARSRDVHLYSLPWPIAELETLGASDVEMRVTLSYFIEPNPSERGRIRRYRYESHGLRFAVKKQLESEAAFRMRIADFARAEEEGQVVDAQDDGWVIGPQLRHRGSIHTDIWRGSATDLAARGGIAIYPTLGWWREQLRHGKYNETIRYSLVVSIETSARDVDLYAPVATAIDQRVAVRV